MSYDTNQAEWFKSKEEMASRMHVDALWFSRIDCVISAESIPWMAGKYRDEASVYVRELIKRGEDVNVLPPEAMKQWKRHL